jgi:hypothetical protein
MDVSQPANTGGGHSSSGVIQGRISGLSDRSALSSAGFVRITGM